jgi:hypothetical protein
MEFLTHCKLDVPKRLAASFAKVRAAIERNDFASSDLKKLTGHLFFRASSTTIAGCSYSLSSRAGRRRV